jgi:hypothetical protein
VTGSEITNILDFGRYRSFSRPNPSPNSLFARIFGANLLSFIAEHGVCVFDLITRPEAHGG